MEDSQQIAARASVPLVNTLERAEGSPEAARPVLVFQYVCFQTSQWQTMAMQTCTHGSR